MTDIKPCFCPACETQVDTATPIGHDRELVVGDITVCLTCTEILEWMGDGFRRLPTSAVPEEKAAGVAVLRRLIRRAKGEA